MKDYTMADYAAYRRSMWKDGMTPMTYPHWLRVQYAADKAGL